MNRLAYNLVLGHRGVVRPRKDRGVVVFLGEPVVEVVAIGKVLDLVRLSGLRGASLTGERLEVDGAGHCSV